LFLGAGVHYGPPAGADQKYLDAYPEARRPPLGRALSMKSVFARKKFRPFEFDPAHLRS
jgi:hypothetical protein